MNFKPNLWKVIVSIIVGIIETYIWPLITCFGAKFCLSSPNIPYYIGQIIVVGLIVYIIWSLFQKK